jgi:hypothetical protein
MALELVHLCDLQITLKDPIMVGSGPAGMRLVYEVGEAKATGERLSGTLLGAAAADWVVVNGTVVTLDVRATLATDDGAAIYTHYSGRSTFSGDPADHPIYVAPLFETGDERYAWLNTIQAVGKGTLSGTDLRYEWYEIR